MPPRSVGQSREIKNLFSARIKEKVAREKAKPLGPRSHRALAVAV